LIVCKKWLKRAYLSDKTSVFDGVSSISVIYSVKASYDTPKNVVGMIVITNLLFNTF